MRKKEDHRGPLFLMQNCNNSLHLSKTTSMSLPPNNDNTEEVSIFDEFQPLPEYYSDRALYVFSVLCGTLFGSILMAMNLSRTPTKKGIWQVIVFGVLFTAMQFTVLDYLPNNNSSSGALVFGILGGGILKWFFWNKYIGANTRYSRRSVLVPAIIAVVLILFVVFAMIRTGLI